MHFNWTQLIPGVGHEYTHIATLVIVSLLIMAMGLVARASLGTGETAVIPSGKVSARGIFEFITEYIGGLSDQVIGHHGRAFAPYFCAIFTYILFNNLAGLIPGMTPATENFNTTFAFGVFSFLAYNVVGLKVGGIGYLKHFLGPVLWLAPLMLIIEIISHIIRPLTLGLRLANVMTGDHTVLAVFLGLFPLGPAIPFYAMGLLVSTIQAFVFTLLSMVYVALATANDH
ncbi:MAG: F0F1 ATP synthase subunit A [Bdellovibrionaceae bacterium]|nr:F0F1 ATP synthase subunit A [Bdellovibrio sp.]